MSDADWYNRFDDCFGLKRPKRQAIAGELLFERSTRPIAPR
jgi:hypothetical protein